MQKIKSDQFTTGINTCHDAEEVKDKVKFFYTAFNYSNLFNIKSDLLFDLNRWLNNFLSENKKFIF